MFASIRSARWPRLMAVVLVAAASIVAVRPVAAEAPTKSLEFAPADASFYLSMLRNREQIEKVTESNAWKKAGELDYVNQLKALATLAMYAPGSPMPQIMEELNKPENKEAVDLLIEMVSDEVFIYGDDRVAGSMDLVRQIRTVQYAAMFRAMLGEDIEDETVVQQMLLEKLAEDPNLIASPTIVIGFKIGNAEPAANQLARLEKLIQQAIDDYDELAIFKGRFKRQTVAGHDYLTLELDGRMAPWEDEIDWDEVEDEQGQYDELRKKINDFKMVISLGVHDEYVLLTVSDSTEHLAQLGKGESLAGTDNLAPVIAAADKPLTGIEYVSAEMSLASNWTKRDVDALAAECVEAVDGVETLSDDQKQRLKKDLEVAADDLKSMLPAPGASVGYSFMTDRGIEGFSLNRAQNLYFDGSQPLTLWQHVGEKPLLAFVARGQYRPQDYAMVSKWAKRGVDWFEELGLPQLPENDRKEYQQFADLAFPLFARFDHVTREMAIPSTADSQAAFVIDADLKSKQWWMFLDETKQPLAIPLPAVVVGLSDTELFKQSLNEYRLIVNDAIKAVAKAEQNGNGNGIENGDEDDAFEVPLPNEREIEGGELFTYDFLQMVGVDDQLAPALALTSETHKLAVFSLAPEQAKKLLKPGAPKFEGGPLADTKRPLAAAFYFDFAGTVDVVVPWVELGVRSYYADMVMAEQFDADLEENGEEPSEEEIEQTIEKRTANMMRQVNGTAELLKCFRGCTSATRIQDGVTITHYELHFVDIE